MVYREALLKICQKRFYAKRYFVLWFGAKIDCKEMLIISL